MSHSSLARLMGVAAVVTLATAPLGANDALTGQWRHEPSASDGNYISGEYPGRLLEIVVLANVVRITQTLGAVKDGIALPGSGNETQTFEVPTDGSTQEIPLGTRMTRQAHAAWKDGALHFSYQVNLPESESLGFTEIWSVSDDRQTLTVERNRDGGRPRTLVFIRVAEPEPHEA